MTWTSTPTTVVLDLSEALAGANRLRAEARESGDANAIFEAAHDVRLAEEALAWFEHQNGMEP